MVLLEARITDFIFQLLLPDCEIKRVMVAFHFSLIPNLAYYPSYKSSVNWMNLIVQTIKKYKEHT